MEKSKLIKHKIWGALQEPCNYTGREEWGPRTGVHLGKDTGSASMVTRGTAQCVGTDAGRRWKHVEIFFRLLLFSPWK